MNRMDNLMSVDVGDNVLHYIVEYPEGNSFHRVFGIAKGFVELDKIIIDLGVECGIMDSGGHREKEVTEFVHGRKNWLRYKGGIGTENWKRSSHDEQLVIANASHYKADALRIPADAATLEHLQDASRMMQVLRDVIDDISK